MQPVDAPLDTLLLPWLQGVLHWPAAPEPVLFLRARAGAALRALPRERWLCEQGYRPAATALERDGLVVVPDLDAAADQAPADTRYPLVLVLPPRQRDEARALLARAVALTAPGGRVVASAANAEGVKSVEGDLRQLAGVGGSLSKHHCRVCWTPPLHGTHDDALQAQWRAQDQPQRIAGGRFLSRPGVFAWDRIDAASALLAEHLPTDLSGTGADLGAGFGFLSAEVMARAPGVRALHLYEAEARALDMARANLAAHASASTALAFHWHDVTAGLPQCYDFIVSNPPFHAQSRHDRPDLGQRFIEVAAQALWPGGHLWLVANRHLPYESVLDARFGQVRCVASRDGYKVIEAVKARP